ncbi:MAG: hypothetical protein EHM70_04370 [Chloroflexota bacterium]|nr:MAG: hypothetical protein EHM70_04370 [Chloroflexota bacterium]
MDKITLYRQHLSTLPVWDEYLMQESGLPGPRSNLELMYAVAAEGDASLFYRYLAHGPETAPVNTPLGFLAMCGTAGLGSLLARGERGVLADLRPLASDPRWRIREAVCMGLQLWGDCDMDALLAEMDLWSRGNLLERRAAAAALCEPRLLTRPEHARAVLRILDDITASLASVSDRKDDSFRVLVQGLSYCWSVAVSALPGEGKALMEKWFSSGDKDVVTIMRDNLQKKRLVRVDAGWVEMSQKRIANRLEELKRRT